LYSLLQDEHVRWLSACFWVLVFEGKHILVSCQSCYIFIINNDDLSYYLQFWSL